MTYKPSEIYCETCDKFFNENGYRAHAWAHNIAARELEFREENRDEIAKCSEKYRGRKVSELKELYRYYNPNSKRNNGNRPQEFRGGLEGWKKMEIGRIAIKNLLEE